MKRTTRPSPARARRARGLTELETDLMQVLWDRREATAADVRDALAPSRGLALTTVITLLDRLCGKGGVEHVKATSRPKRYRPLLEPETVAAGLLESVQRRFFGGSPSSLFAHLLESGEVDDRELEEIRKLLANARR